MHVQIENFKTCRWQHLVNTVFAVITGENVEGNIIALERFQANKAVRHVWQQRSKLLRKNFVFTNNSQMFSNIFLISMDRQNNTRSLLYFQTKISKLRLVYIHPRFTLISWVQGSVWGFIVYVHSFAKKVDTRLGLTTTRPMTIETSVKTDVQIYM